MKKYDLIIFDLDGTLADTSSGIYNCHRFANRAMGREEPSDAELSGVIGGPLLNTYIERFGYSHDDAVKAVSIYREHYATEGINGAELYQGMAQALITLRERGYKLAVATLKAEKLAVPMLKKLGIAEYFDVIHGVDSNDKLSKKDLVLKCVEELGAELGRTVLVGDSIHDANGAAQANVDIVICTYGFGFTRDDDFSAAAAVIHSARELTEVFE